MRNAWLAAILLVSGLTGCLADPGTCAGLEARWTQPGLHERIDADADVGGWHVQSHPVPEGVPFTNATLDAAWGHDAYALTRVEWDSTDTPGRRASPPLFALRGNGSVEATAGETLGEQALRERFTTFTRTLTDASNATIAGWADAFVASQEPHVSFRRADSNRSYQIHAYTVEIDGPWNLSAHAAELGIPQAALDETRQGHATVEAGDWAYRFDFAEKTAEHTDRDDEDVLEVRVDSFDRVFARTSQDHGNEMKARELIEDGFDELGWGEAGVTEEQIHVAELC